MTRRLGELFTESIRVNHVVHCIVIFIVSYIHIRVVAHSPLCIVRICIHVLCDTNSHNGTFPTLNCLNLTNGTQELFSLHRIMDRITFVSETEHKMTVGGVTDNVMDKVGDNLNKHH